MFSSFLYNDVELISSPARVGESFETTDSVYSQNAVIIIANYYNVRQNDQDKIRDTAEALGG